MTVLQGSAIIAGREVAKVDVPEDGATVIIAPNSTSRFKGLSIAISINNLLTTILDNLNDLMSKDFTKVIANTSLQFAVTVNGQATISGNMRFDKQTSLGSLGLTESSKRIIRPPSDNLVQTIDHLFFPIFSIVIMRHKAFIFVGENGFMSV